MRALVLIVIAAVSPIGGTVCELVCTDGLLLASSAPAAVTAGSGAESAQHHHAAPPTAAAPAFDGSGAGVSAPAAPCDPISATAILVRQGFRTGNQIGTAALPAGLQDHEAARLGLRSAHQRGASPPSAARAPIPLRI